MEITTFERRSDRKHRIKGLLYINISILITLWSFYISLFIDEEFNTNFLMILLVMCLWRLRNIFLRKEAGIDKRERLFLFALCVIDYLGYALAIISWNYDLKVLQKWSFLGGAGLCMGLVTGYLSLLFGKDQTDDTN